jgi:hypothetical protein
MTTAGVAELRRRLAGTLYAAGEDGYQRLAAAWNLVARQQPAAVVAPASASDVVQVVRLAGAEGLRVAVQTTGHGAAGTMGADTLLLNMRTMNTISVNAEARIAEVGAGTTWGELAQQVVPPGLAALAGTAGGIGIAGYTFHGGLGWQARAHGLASASLLSVAFVDAAGRIGHADEQSDPDALWAFRGGGGVGIATRLRIRLFPHAHFYAGTRMWPVEHTPAILARWLDWTAQVPRSLTSMAWALHAPDRPGVPEPLRGRAAIAIGACGTTPDTDRAAIADCFAGLPAPLLDTFRDRSFAELAEVHMDPRDPAPARGDGRLISRPDTSLAVAMFQAAGIADRGPLAVVELRHLGGAVADAGSAGALTALDGEFGLYATGIAGSTEQMSAVDAKLKQLSDAAAPVDLGRSIATFRGGQQDAPGALGAVAARRLQQLGEQRDSHNMLYRPRRLTA